MDAPRTNLHPSTARPRAWVETYGCQMNVSDGELMQGVLAASGYDMAASPDDAHVILVNTCAIREHAEQRVIGRVGEFNRIKLERPDVVIGVTGCMAQRLGTTLLDGAHYVDLVMGPDGYRTLPEVLARLRPGLLPEPSVAGDEAAGSVDVAPRQADEADSVHGAPQPSTGADATRMTRSRRELPVLADSDPVSIETPVVDRHANVDLNGRAHSRKKKKTVREAVLELTPDENYEGLEVRRSSRVSAWVPVQRGCNYRCTYCIVPYVRGSEKNREPERVLDEVRGIAEDGITEVVLLGQTVNSWTSSDWTFADLLRAVARVDGIRRVRFTSPHPNDLTQELIDVMASEPSVCRQLHLPVQSGHDRTLRRMLRRYTVESYLAKLAAVREAMPNIALSTDVIVAFPGETDDEYEATLALMREVRYDEAYLYKYSLRDGTPATRLPEADFVDPAIAQSRLERIIAMQRAIQAEINAAEVGRETDVLVERQARSEGDVMGRTDAWKVVAFPGDTGLVGRYVRVRLTATTGATFRGVRIGRSADVERFAIA
jgi:MiaB/RimO family radical SAM methylthiotransferase